MNAPLNQVPERAIERKGSFGQTLRAVAWSFFGIRRSADYERDVQRLNPVHVVVAGVLGAIVFVGLLVVLVRWVVGSGVAT
jgi:Protein of unknown function (DUF2970)